MKKKKLEFILGLLLLTSALGLSREMAKTTQSQGVVSNVILVDPGHGGTDPGVIGLNNRKEKEINLAISLKLKACLEKEGFQVLLTRERDEGLYDANTQNKKVQDLQRRCQLIQKEKPCVTLSIHQNSYSDPEVSGPQVFYYTDSGEGEKLAQALQKELNEKLSVSKPRVPKGNTSYFLLKKSEGVLNIVECGFLTNPREAALLETEAYQQQVAHAICQGTCEYLENK